MGLIGRLSHLDGPQAAASRAKVATATKVRRTTPRLPIDVTLGYYCRAATIRMRTRRLRTALSALGIMIGIGAMVGVLGLSQSSKSELLAQLDRLGTNLFTVEPSAGLGRSGREVPTLPHDAAAMIARIGPIESTSMLSAVDDDLLDVLGGSVADGVRFDDARASAPTVALGAVAAERLGVREVTGTGQVWLGGRWFIVIGILDTFELAPDIDRAALIGQEAAATFLDHDNLPSPARVSTDPAKTDQVTAVLAATANPQFPEEVEVAKPTDALEAEEAADDTLTALFLGLGAVALLVGGVGIANVMVIAVLERRGEIGLRRALGALGGVGGVLLGFAATTVYASASAKRLAYRTLPISSPARSEVPSNRTRPRF